MIQRRRWGQWALGRFALGAWGLHFSVAAAPRLATDSAPVVWPRRTALLDGEVLSAEVLQGQGLLVVFWATHCAFCLRHNTKLQQVLTTMGAAAPRVLGVSLDRDAALVRRHLATHGHRFDVTLDAAPWLAALGARRVLPTTVAVNRLGQRSLPMPGEMFEEDLAELLQWSAAPAG